MAVYTQLSDGFARYMLSVYPAAGELLSLQGIPAGSTNTSYRLETSKGLFFLRVGEKKAFADLVYEKNLLVFLAAQEARLGGVQAPRLVPNSAGGYFFPVEVDPTASPYEPTKYACLFEALRGRELGVFEIGPEHVAQLGEAVARLHVALKGFHGRRANPYRAPVLAAWLTSLGHAKLGSALQMRLRAAFRQVARERRPLPRGVIHGDLFANNTKWYRGRLDAIFDWEMAGRDHLLLDVAIAMNAWCWRRDRAGGGAFDPALARALLEGYQGVRQLEPSERRGFFVECCLGALRFALSRIRDFGTLGEDAALLPAFPAPGQPAPKATDTGPQRDFLDYREYLQRLEGLRAMGPRGLRALCGLG